MIVIYRNLKHIFGLKLEILVITWTFKRTCEDNDVSAHKGGGAGMSISGGSCL